ncbi:MAG: DeoR/GlpR family DNA-binding transcription regulator [Lachnospiraceae bacterium]|nr:DeoR/GlpR family DNA-binding transcription regulator [Lachnospiraceae bacterium]
MRVDRIDSLEKYIIDRKSVTLDELCDKFTVSKNTLRRDIETLLKRGNIKKVYGGVVSNEKTNAVGLKPFNERNTIHLELKQSIAERMASLIEDGDTIFVDTGSSTLPLASLLDRKQNLTIVTNSVPFIYTAIAHPSLNVIALPGTLNRSTDSLVGATTIESLKRFHVKKSIMACTGLSLDHGVCNASFAEYEIKKLAMSICDHAYLLADSFKFDVTSMMSYAEIKQFHTVITDAEPDPRFERAFNEHKVRILY